MTEKKYAIVRVDNKCSLEMEDNYRCTEDLRKEKCKKCKEIYGDTKEQLIRKVAQGIIIASRKRQIYIANSKAFSKAVSKIIIEFLGIKK